MNIITRGLGVNQQIVTQGYGRKLFVHITENYSGVGKANKFGYKYLKDLLDDVIKTEEIKLKKDKDTVFVEVTLVYNDPFVDVELNSIEYKDL